MRQFLGQDYTVDVKGIKLDFVLVLVDDSDDLNAQSLVFVLEDEREIAGPSRPVHVS